MLKHLFGSEPKKESTAISLDPRPGIAAPYCYQLRSWKGYESEIKEQLEACIRRYRFTGSFIAYLFKTLEYRGRGLRFIYSYSLDDQMLLGEKRRIENVVQDAETGEISYFKPF